MAVAPTTPSSATTASAVATTATTDASTAPFGTVPAPYMVVSEAIDGVYGSAKVEPVAEIGIHPFAHALHYGSACFEGLKAHRGVDGIVRLFRHQMHVARMQRTAELLFLPPPPVELLEQAIVTATARNLDVAPPAPGALYLRPLLLGTDANIGAAAAPSNDALLLVLASPVGDYFAGGARALTLKVETDLPRTTPQFGEAKAGANYVMALGPTRRARAEHGADQVLFAPGGEVQETGAANFLLIDDERIVTRALDPSFLHGVTRDSILQLGRDLGYRVEERAITVDELRSWQGEAALSGTAAVLAGVGTLITDQDTITLGDGSIGPNTTRLREALVSIQRAETEDDHGWLTPVTAD